MALALVAPEARRLTDVLIFNRTPRPSSPTALVSTPRRARLLLAAQLLFGAYLVVMNFHHALKGWQTFGPPAPRSALYGIWTVDQIMIDGVVRPAVATDNERWRRVIFDWPPTLLTYQRMNDTLGFEGGVEIDTSARRISRSGPGATIALSYEQPAAERLNLDGRIGERQLRLEMTRLDHRTFRLLNQKIHWVQD
jgi:hypothetical protein